MDHRISEEELKKWKRKIGYRVRDLRDEKCWSQEALAFQMVDEGLTSMNASTISYIENGHTLPTLVTLMYLSKVFGVSLDDIAG